MKTAVQQIMIGTLCNSEKKASETLAAIRNMGYDALELNAFMVQPMSMHIRMLTRLAGMPTGSGGKLDWPSLLRDSGLGVVSLHSDMGSILKRTDEVIRMAETYHADTVVITGMYHFAYTDAAAVQELSCQLNEGGKRLKEAGISLLYHNHNCEFRRLPDGSFAYDYILTATDPAYVNFEFDSYWAAECGADALGWMRRLGTRLKLWHVNDRGSRSTGAVMPILKSDAVELGTGTMPLDTLYKAATEAGVSAVVLETHKNWINHSPLDSITLSGKWLQDKARS